MTDLRTGAQSVDSATVRLGRKMGIEPVYINALGERVVIAPEVIRSILSAMGCDAADDIEAEGRLKEIEIAADVRKLPPVLVVKEDQFPVDIPVNLGPGEPGLPWRLVLEDGTTAFDGVIGPPAGSHDAKAGTGPRAKLPSGVTVTEKLPWGYHRLEIQGCVMPLIVTPVCCWLPPELEKGDRIWGLAAQLYLLRSAHNWGIGDFGDLGALINVAAKSGASVIGLNPLHAMFLDNPEHASPYSPASRLFLNVLNIDVSAIPEFKLCPNAQALVNRREFSDELEKVRARELVDYQSVEKLKIPILHVIFEYFNREAVTERMLAFRKFVSDGALPLRRFCTFQAIRMKFAASDAALVDWRKWPDEIRRSDSVEVEQFAVEHADEIDFLSWMQWVADLQLSEAAQAAKSQGMLIALYRDLAVGSDAAGAESWSQPDTVIERAHVGVPPDVFNPAGQDWGLPPLDPQKLRERGYQDYVQLIRANMRHAGALRIDHALGLQHFYWIPDGNSPSQGAYVSYPFDDLTGILALESWRNKCLVVGEDLGTVPAGFRDRLSKRRIFSYRVLYFEQDEKSGEFRLPEEYPKLAVATVGSHDLATLRGWWLLDDIKLRKQHDLYPDPVIGEHHQKQRAQEKLLLLKALRNAGFHCGDGSDEQALSLAVHGYLAKSHSAIVMLQMENLTGEDSQINLPGTSSEHPNWRRRLSMPLEQISTSRKINEILELVKRERSRTQLNSSSIRRSGGLPSA